MDSYLPDVFLNAVRDLIRDSSIRSVSCPVEPDARLWRILVDEQLRRVEQTGLPAEDAFFLAGPDQRCDIDESRNEWFEEIKSWHGLVHVPYEGACGGDLFFVPEYWNSAFDKAMKDGAKLRWAVHRPCNHVLVKADYGELPCAMRAIVGEGWVLYTSTAPHEDCHPMREAEASAKRLRTRMASNEGNEG
jgi:hypothetical protein